MKTLPELEQEAWSFCLQVKNDPQERYESRERFYDKYGHASTDGFGYGNSELAFMHWEQRGVLRPPDANPPGSPWWSAVNLWFLYLCTLAELAHDLQFPKDKLPAPSQFWLDFMKTPSPQVWYRAHNSSIIDGYLKYPDLASKENKPEQILINMVLYRLLYAQAMVEGAHYAFGELGELFANPRGKAVDLITHLDPFYPAKYPLTQEEVNDILGRSHNLEELGVKIMDEVLIAPILSKLYDDSSIWNQQPELNTLIINHQPAYPNGVGLAEAPKGLLIKVLIWIRSLFSRNT